MDIGALHFLQSFNRLIPPPIIVKLLRKSSSRSPYMGFVVEPHSLFLFHKITDPEKAATFLPKRFRLLKCKVFEDDTPEYYVIIGTLNTHTSGFWGIRQESYVVAEDTQTGLLSWIIIDIMHNTLGFSPKMGLTDPNSTEAVFTTNARGIQYLDIEKDDGTHRLELSCDLTQGTMKPLDQRLWLEGNLSIDYSAELSNGIDDPFAVIFDPVEVEQALDIPPDAATITTNDRYPDFMERTPSKIASFPYAQHFFSDSPGHRTIVRNKQELIETYHRLASTEKLLAFDAATVRKQFFLSLGISMVISTSLIVFLFIHFIVAH